MRLLDNKIFAMTLALALNSTLESTVGYADLDDLDPNEPVATPAPSRDRSVPATQPPTERNTPETSSSSNTEKQPSKVKSSNPKSMKMAPEDPETARKEPIRLKSKGLKAQKDGAIVELTDDVSIIQGNLKLLSDYAKVYFDKASNEVSKAEAQGRVVVQRDSPLAIERMTAHADKATFLNAERKIVFTGNASVNRNGSILKGKKVFYDMSTGWITFEGAEGVMQPGREPSPE